MKTYLRYVPTTTFGVVASSSQCTDVLLDGKGKRATAACLEEACTFDLRQGAKVVQCRREGTGPGFRIGVVRHGFGRLGDCVPPASIKFNQSIINR
jgi:hypothetical protein